MSAAHLNTPDLCLTEMEETDFVAVRIAQVSAVKNIRNSLSGLTLTARTQTTAMLIELIYTFL